MNQRSASPTIADFSNYFNALSSKRRESVPQAPLLAAFSSILRADLSHAELASLKRLIRGEGIEPAGRILTEEKLARLAMVRSRMTERSHRFLRILVEKRLAEIGTDAIAI